MKFKVIKNLDDLPDEYINQYCEILYFSECFKYCEVIFSDDSQWFISLTSLDPQGAE